MGRRVTSQAQGKSWWSNSFKTKLGQGSQSKWQSWGFSVEKWRIHISFPIQWETPAIDGGVSEMHTLPAASSRELWDNTIETEHSADSSPHTPSLRHSSAHIIHLSLYDIQALPLQQTKTNWRNNTNQGRVPPWLVWLSLLQCCPVDQRVKGSIPSWGTYEKVINQCFSLI